MEAKQPPKVQVACLTGSPIAPSDKNPICRSMMTRRRVSNPERTASVHRVRLRLDLCRVPDSQRKHACGFCRFDIPHGTSNPLLYIQQRLHAIANHKSLRCLPVPFLDGFERNKTRIRLERVAADLHGLRLRLGGNDLLPSLFLYLLRLVLGADRILHGDLLVLDGLLKDIRIVDIRENNGTYADRLVLQNIAHTGVDFFRCLVASVDELVRLPTADDILRYANDGRCQNFVGILGADLVISWTSSD